MKPKRVPENSLPLNQRILVQRRIQMEMFPTCSLLASSPVIIMLLLWYSESVFFCVVVFPLLLLLFVSFRHIYTPFLFHTSIFWKKLPLQKPWTSSCCISLQYQSCILFPVEAKKANTFKLPLFRHECCGQNTPGIYRHLKSNWKYMLCSLFYALKSKWLPCEIYTEACCLNEKLKTFSPLCCLNLQFMGS